MIEAFSIPAKILALLAAFCLLSNAVQAEPPVPTASPAPAKPCVLLKNHNVLFGTAQQRGEYVIVRKQDGSQIQLDRKQVACWSSSIRGLYRFRADNRQSFGPRAHLDEARWCMRYDLHDLAARELATVLRLDPNHQTATRMADQLRRARQAKTSEAKTNGQPVPTKAVMDGSSVQLAAHAQPVAFEESVDPETLQRFVRQIQPLLLNRCGICHGQDSDRSWKLVLPARGTRATSRITHANLSATMKFVQAGNPDASELRARAIDGHAGKKATLGTRALVATRALDQWLRSIRPSQLPIESQTTVSANQGRQPKRAAEPVQQASHVAEASKEQPRGPKDINRLPPVTNPFDPKLFNRRFHRGQ